MAEQLFGDDYDAACLLVLEAFEGGGHDAASVAARDLLGYSPLGRDVTTMIVRGDQLRKAAQS